MLEATNKGVVMLGTRLMIVLLVLLAGCVPGSAPNGMSWDEYHAAKYRLKVIYRAKQVAACRELGQVRGTAYDDIGAAKEAAREQALLIGGDTLLLRNLWSDPLSPQLFVGRELFYAAGSAYRCVD